MVISLKRIAVGVFLGVGALYALGRSAATRADVEELKRSTRELEVRACGVVLAEMRMGKAGSLGRWRAMGCK